MTHERCKTCIYYHWDAVHSYDDTDCIVYDWCSCGHNVENSECKDYKE